MSDQEPKNIQDAVDFVKANAKEKFDAAVEAHFRLGIDPKKGEQQVRGSVALPHGTGKDVAVTAFVTDVAAVRKELGDMSGVTVGGEELIAEIKSSGKVNFDVAVATPEMMPKLAQVAKILGPKGLMPSPKSETVTPNVAKTVKELKAGKITFKTDDTANLHTIIGKVSFDAAKLAENFQTLMQELKRLKPSGSKGEFIRAVYLSSSMGKSVPVAV